MSLSEAEIERYSRHILLKEIGGAGQQKLKNTHILVVGAGGLGCPALAYLSTSGVGHLGVVDNDTVSVSNLQRQFLYSQENLHRPKTEIAEKACLALNPSCRFTCYNRALDKVLAKQIFSQYDVILDCTDNFSTRSVISEEAAQACVPLVVGAAQQFKGSITVFAPFLGNNPSYTDLFPQTPPAEEALNCAQLGIFSPVTGVIGSLQAVEALKLVLKIGQPLIGRLLIYDALAGSMQIFAYQKPPSPR